MFLIVGYIIILGASIGTYAVHGSLAALWVPMEYIAIVGLTLGAFLACNDIKIIKATIGALPSLFKGSSSLWCRWWHIKVPMCRCGW